MSRPDLLPHVRAELQHHHDTHARLLAATRGAHRPLLGDVLQGLLLVAKQAARLTAAATLLVAGVAGSVAYLFPVPLP